jgi:hypothetical protein
MITAASPSSLSQLRSSGVACLERGSGSGVVKFDDTHSSPGQRGNGSVQMSQRVFAGDLGLNKPPKQNQRNAMKTKTPKKPKQTQRTVQLKDLKPKRDPKGGGLTQYADEELLVP